MKEIVYAIVLAAGKGSRMGASINKQFLEIGGIPVIARTLMAFEKSVLIDGIVLVCSSDEENAMRDICVTYDIKKIAGFVNGGDLRKDSSQNALMFVENHLVKPEHKSDTIVLIHDGARPFVSQEIIQRAVESVRLHGSGVCATRVKDTIKECSDKFAVEKTLDRAKLWAVQTPQGFRLDIIARFYERLSSETRDFTDDASVAEHYGYQVFIFEGDYKNIKITTPEDLCFGEGILKG